jgi:hypothetical protein
MRFALEPLLILVDFYEKKRLKTVQLIGLH